MEKISYVHSEHFLRLNHICSYVYKFKCAQSKCNKAKNYAVVAPVIKIVIMVETTEKLLEGALLKMGKTMI